MPKIIIIKTSGDIITAVATLDRIRKNLPKMVRLGMRRWGSGSLERDMKISAKMAGIKSDTGLAFGKGIRYEQGPRSDVGFLFMRLHLVYLDSMKPHYVSVHVRRMRLLDWAKHAEGTWIRKKAKMVERGKIKKFSVYVTPHPFIELGYKMARPKLAPILRNLVSRGVKNA